MQTQKTVRLVFSDLATGGHSDKEYRLQLITDGDRGAAVAAHYGRRNAALTSGYLSAGGGWSKTVVVMTPDQAKAAYDKKLTEKQSNGYRIDAQTDAGTSGASVEVSTVSSGVEQAGEPPCELLTEIDEAMALSLVEDPMYWMQKKENGRRLQIRKRGARVDGINRKGQVVPLATELARDVALLPHASLLTDGEAIGDSTIVFDLLDATIDMRTKPYWLRFATLITMLDGKGMGGHVRAVQTWRTVEEKRAGLKLLRESHAEGAVFKRIYAPFYPGRNGQHFKFKFIKSLTAKIIPKAADDEAKGHNSIALGLLNSAGEWICIGHASGIGKGELPLGAHVEIKYLYGYGSKQAPHLVQARVEGLRDDLTDEACTISQVQFHEGQGQ